MAARRVDWSFGPGHGPVSGVVNSSASALGLTMIADLASVPPLWGLVGGTFAAAGAIAASLAQDAPGKAVAYRGLCWLGAGGWSTYALATATSEPFSGPWSTPSLASLLVGTIGAAFTGLAFQRGERKAEEERQQDVAAELERLRLEAAAATLASEHDRIAALWEAEIRRQTKREVKVEGVEFWNPNTGFTLDITLPADGTTIEDIKPFEKSLATAMDVPPGCAVEVVDPEIERRVVHIRVGTVDAMAEDHHLPEVCEQDTIENPLSMGIRSDRTEATISLRYNCAVLIGQTDSGKSNQLNVITRQVVRCTDALSWAIDLSGNGRYPRPWVRAWHEGRAVAPAIDWVAPNAEEALFMTEAALAIIAWRTADYEQLMFEQDWDKIMVSPEIPEVVISVDEFGALPDRVKENLQQISDQGRGAGVRVVSCALEAKSKYIPVEMITQARERMGMRVQDEAQLQYLFDRTWRQGRFDMSTMRIQGAGLSSTNASPPEKFKGWRITPARIDAESITVGPWRPPLDDASVARCDTLILEVRSAEGFKMQQEFTRVYTDRWKRTLPLIFPKARAGAERQQVSVAADRQPSSAQREQPREQAPSLGKAMADLEAAQQRLAEVEPLPDSGPVEEDLPQADWSVVESWLKDGAPATDSAGKRKPIPRIRMRQLVWDAGEAGIGPTAVHKQLEAEGYATTYQTVNGWMKDDARPEVGILFQAGQREPYTRGPRMANPYEG
jgi:S-DNA-T family DNA segregation ATPase FtsK/SpoIIIE